MISEPNVLKIMVIRTGTHQFALKLFAAPSYNYFVVMLKILLKVFNIYLFIIYWYAHIDCHANVEKCE